MRLKPAVYLFVCVSAMASGSEVFGQSADVIYHGGDSVTVDDKNPAAEALAVKAGKIIAVGRKDDVLKLKGDATKQVDLGGQDSCARVP